MKLAKKTRVAPNKLNQEKLLERARNLSIPGIKIFPETVCRKGTGYFFVLTECLDCGARREKELRNMEKGFSSKCQCKNAGWYGDKRAYTLGCRYSSMVQRCERDTHVSSHNYKDRGIKVEFSSRREFILWALETWPDEDFKGKDFDRIDNEGNYSKTNLRLVDRTTNLLNRRDTAGKLNIGHGRDFLKRHPEITYTAMTVLRKLRSGMSEEELIEHHRTSPRAVGRRKHKPEPAAV